MNSGLSRSTSAKKSAATKSAMAWAVERNRIQDFNTDWYWAIKENEERNSNGKEV